MCGKFEARLTWDEYCDLAGAPDEDGVMAPTTVLRVFTPMSRVPVLHLGPSRQRRITLMRWGWLDPKLADPARGFSHLHARSEEIERTPTWVEPFRSMRGRDLQQVLQHRRGTSGRPHQAMGVQPRRRGRDGARRYLFFLADRARKTDGLRDGHDGLVPAARSQGRAHARDSQAGGKSPGGSARRAPRRRR